MDRKIGIMTIREWVGVLILLLLLAVGLGLSWYMDRQHGEISRNLEDSAWFALSGEWSKARDTADSARQQWEQGRNLWSAFSDHRPMEEIDTLFAALKIHAAAGERTEFAEACAALAHRVEAMGSAHQLSWWNVL